MPLTPTGTLGSSEPPALLRIDDLSAADLSGLLQRARELTRGAAPCMPERRFSVGLLFLAPSLRTRVGFAAAAAQLGGAPIAVGETRVALGMSAAEAFTDTIRVVSGMVDVLIARTPFEVPCDMLHNALAAPYVNAGDGPHGEHPTQALIDVLAMEEEHRSSVASLAVGVCGDLRTRSARSLLALLERMPPRELRLMAPPGRDRVVLSVGGALEERVTRATALDVEGLDVLYLVGLPAGSGSDRLDPVERARFALVEASLRVLPADAIVLSPMPVIDEIAPAARADPRIRVFAQSDRGLHLRVALLERLLGASY